MAKIKKKWSKTSCGNDDKNFVRAPFAKENKTRRGSCAKIPSSSPSPAAERKGKDALPDEDIDDAGDDDRSASSASSFSYIRSILARRRRRTLPAAFANVRCGDDEGTEGGVLHARDRPGGAGSRRRRTPRRRSGRDCEGGHERVPRSRADPRCRFYFPQECRPVHPLVLLALVALASDWMAGRVWNAALTEEKGAVHIPAGERAGPSLRKSQEERSSPIERSSSGLIQHQRMRRSNGLQASGDYRSESNNNAVGPSNNDRQTRGIHLFNQTEDLARGISREGGTPPPQLTKRFVDLRRRLLSLYSEAVPSDDASSGNSSAVLHPLYTARSAQYRALDWLANVDGLRLRATDPGIVQRYVLAVMYFSTGGPAVTRESDLSRKHRGPWRNPTNFLSPSHECEWKSRIIDGAGRGGGIRRCDKNRTVVEISLYNDLKGIIPSELGRLWNLRTLYLGRNRLVGTIPTELGMIRKLSSLSLQWNDLSGTIPQRHLKNLLTLRALQVEGNEKISGNLHRHSLLCQMRNKYRDTTPGDQERYTGRRVLRILTATCIPSGGSVGVSDRLECACCTECFGKRDPKELIYS